MWDAIIYPLPNFNGATIEVWQWISNFIPHFKWIKLHIQAGIEVKPC